MSFSAFINKGSSYFAGKDQNEIPIPNPSATDFFLDRTPVDMGLTMNVWTIIDAFTAYSAFLPNSNFTHHIDGTITYNGDPALYVLNYNISSLPVFLANPEIGFEIWINSDQQASSLCFTTLESGFYKTSSGTVMITLLNNDIISLRCNIAANETLRISSVALNIFQLK